MAEVQAWRLRRKYYHTPSTIPDCVRAEVVQGWDRMWSRLRRKPPRERSEEFIHGVPIVVGATRFVLRHGEECITDIQRREYWALELGGNETRVTVSCAFGACKPYIYLDELQAAMDELIVKSVSEI